MENIIIATPNHSSGRLRLKAILSLVGSLILPPLGLILAVWLFWKGLRSAPRKFSSFGILLVLTAALGTAGYVYYYYNIYTKPLRYTYEHFSDYTLPGFTKGGQLTFKKPVEFIKHPTAKADVLYRTELGMWLVSSKALVAQAGIGIASIKTPVSEGYAENIDKLLSGPDNTNYKQYVKSLQGFLENELSYMFFQGDPAANIKLNLGSAQGLTTNNLKGKAWKFDFSASDSRLSQNKQSVSKVKGVYIFAVGKETYYYFMMGAVDYTWDANQPAWQRVLDNLKIDQ